MEREVELWNKLLQNEYLLWKFPCYTDHEDTKGLQCQIEYAVGGKESDMENLKSVAGQLSGGTGGCKRCPHPEQCGKTFSGKCNGHDNCIRPGASGGFRNHFGRADCLLGVCGECSGRQGTSGRRKKLHWVKSSSSWQLSLENLPGILEGLDSLRKSSDNGLTYKEYLRLLLLKEESRRSMPERWIW